MLTLQEIWSYIRLFFRWWPLWISAILISSSSAWLIAKSQPNYYVARTTLMVGTNFSVAAPDRNSVDISNVLAQYYSAIVRREAILKPTIEDLDLNLPWEIVAQRMLSTSIDAKANLLEISITDANPERAAALANAIAERLIAYTPSSETGVAEQRAEIDKQIAETRRTLDQIEQKIADLEQRQSSLDSAIDLRDIQDQLKSLQASRERYQANFNNLVTLSNNTSVNSLTIFEHASIPTVALPRKTSLSVIIAAVGGLVLAIVAILVLDWLDDRWRTGADLRSRLHLNYLGTLAQPQQIVGKPSALDDDPVIKNVQEIFTATILAAKHDTPQVLLVTSPQASEGRAILATNLAYAFARGGHSVLLVSADLNLPEATHLMHDLNIIAQTPRALALGEKQPAIPAHLHGVSSRSTFILKDNIYSTDIPHVTYLPVATYGADQTAQTLFPALYWPQVVAELRTISDIVIIDGPAVLRGPEASLIAPLVDGVVMAVNPRQNGRAQIRSAVSRFTSRTGVHLLGGIIIGGTAPKAHTKPVSRPAPRAVRNGKISIKFTSTGIVISVSPRAKQEPVMTEPRPAADATAKPALASNDKGDQPQPIWPMISNTPSQD